MEEEEKTMVNQISQWNLSESTIQLMGNLLREATYYYGKGMLQQAFTKWKSVFLLVSARFSKEEIAELRRIEFLLAEKGITHTEQTFGSKKINLTEMYNIYFEEYVLKLNQIMRAKRLDITDKTINIKLD